MKKAPRLSRLVAMMAAASLMSVAATRAQADVILGTSVPLAGPLAQFGEVIRDGYLPKDAIDSIDAARYLEDNEEYWPFEGDDWPDEFVGAEDAQ